MSMPRHSASPSDRQRIRELFTNRRTAYGLAEAASALGLSPDAVRQAIASGAVDGAGRGDEVRLAWEEVVTLAALRRWTPRIMSNALPDGMVLPLAKRERRRVDLPRYMWELLAILAAERTAAEGRLLTVSDLIEEAVDQTHVSGITPWSSIEERIPGVTAATVWPLVWEVVG